MTRIDQSEWILISDRICTKKNPWEEIPINLDFPCDRAIVAINLLTAKPSWVQGGGVSQRWSRLFVPIEVKYSSLKLSYPKVISIEPLEKSILWFWTHHWITEIQIVLEVRRITDDFLS
jgi:hypothetical protein